jgi:hypothetical protein
VRSRNKTICTRAAYLHRLRHRHDTSSDVLFAGLLLAELRDHRWSVEDVLRPGEKPHGLASGPEGVNGKPMAAS